MSKKLDNDQFERWFPKSQDPTEYFKIIMKEEIDIIQCTILDMVKMWDAKIVRLRNDMNIHSILKSIGTKADQFEVNENFASHSQRVD